MCAFPTVKNSSLNKNSYQNAKKEISFDAKGWKGWLSMYFHPSKVGCIVLLKEKHLHTLVHVAYKNKF
jgi:major membrane immunogen (membrane-anchored lipoprotein)